MKKVEAVFEPSKLGPVREAIFKHGVHRFLVSRTSVHEYEEPSDSRWNSQSTDEESATVKVEAIVADEVSLAVAKAILKVARTRRPTVTVSISPVDEIFENLIGEIRSGLDVQVTLSQKSSNPKVRHKGDPSTVS
jgi:nitrogen regulatory protein PII